MSIRRFPHHRNRTTPSPALRALRCPPECCSLRRPRPNPLLRRRDSRTLFRFRSCKRQKCIFVHYFNSYANLRYYSTPISTRRTRGHCRPCCSLDAVCRRLWLCRWSIWCWRRIPVRSYRRRRRAAYRRGVAHIYRRSITLSTRWRGRIILQNCQPSLRTGNKSKSSCCDLFKWRLKRGSSKCKTQ